MEANIVESLAEQTTFLTGLSRHLGAAFLALAGLTAVASSCSDNLDQVVTIQSVPEVGTAWGRGGSRCNRLPNTAPFRPWPPTPSTRTMAPRSGPLAPGPLPRHTQPFWGLKSSSHPQLWSGENLLRRR